MRGEQRRLRRLLPGFVGGGATRHEHAAQQEGEQQRDDEQGRERAAEHEHQASGHGSHALGYARSATSEPDDTPRYL